MKFALKSASWVIFPPHNPVEHRQSIYKSQRQSTILTKWAASDLRRSADRALALAEVIKLSEPEMNELLVDHLSSDQDFWTSACQWLRSSSVWQEWLPSDTQCHEGKGLVDAQGGFVNETERAVSCGTCPVGTYSRSLGKTRVCDPCPAGSHQNLPGESNCKVCEIGTVAAVEGQMDCAPCGLGEYANATGMSSCYKCREKDELWTTSEAVARDGTARWIQVQGATSEQQCGCVPGSFMHRGECVLCGEGTSCPGSSELLLLPGHLY